MRNRLLFRILGATALVIVCTAGIVRTADLPDAWVTMKIKTSLMTTEGISTSNLNVDTVNGIVTLHGMVTTEAEKVKAGDIARQIDGTKVVKNLLQIVPKSDRAVVERSDEEIKDNIDKAFKANRRVDPSGIKVASVNKGVVLLSGKTISLEAHLESVEVASAVPGVRRVSTEVAFVPAS